MYLVFLLISDSRVSKTLGISSVIGVIGSSFVSTEATFGGSLDSFRMGDCDQEDQTLIRNLEISVSSPTSDKRSGARH